MASRRTYSDEELAHAVMESRSWRGVLRALGLSGTSAAAIRSARRHCDRLGLDYSHFSGHRTWTDADLERAVEGARSWGDVVRTLGLVGSTSVTTVKGHAARLSLCIDHLSPDGQDCAPEVALEPDLANLPRAGATLAASWFMLCGSEVSWPLEPCPYDLVVLLHGQQVRVQVKTATVRSGASWVVWLSRTRGSRRLYDPDEIDYFFVVTGDLSYYLIPVNEVGGLHAIHLNAYDRYRVRPGDDGL